MSLVRAAGAWGRSSSGRASRWQCEGARFESGRLHVGRGEVSVIVVATHAHPRVGVESPAGGRGSVRAGLEVDNPHPCAGSSVGQSCGLLIRRSRVRISLGVLEGTMLPTAGGVVERLPSAGAGGGAAAGFGPCTSPRVCIPRWSPTPPHAFQALTAERWTENPEVAGSIPAEGTHGPVEAIACTLRMVDRAGPAAAGVKNPRQPGSNPGRSTTPRTGEPPWPSTRPHKN